MKKNLIISGAFMTVILLGLSFIGGGVDQNTQVSQVRRATEQKTEISLEAQAKNFVNYVNSLQKSGEIESLGTLKQGIKDVLKEKESNLKNKSRSLTCGAIYTISGGDPFVLNDTDLYEFDGQAWDSTPQNILLPRMAGDLISFQGKLWLVGGIVQAPNNIFNDVWYSQNGNFVQFDHDPNIPGIQNAPWSPRHSFVSFVYDNKLWIFGGFSLKELWSFDGVSWTQFDFDPSTSGIQDASVLNNGDLTIDRSRAVIFNNKVWMLLRDSSNNESTLWSFDGVSFTEFDHDSNTPGVQSPPFGPVYTYQMQAYNNKIWVMGGSTPPNPSAPSNDVWSFDGVSWTQEPTPPWSTRAWFGSGVKDNKLWIFGGAHVFAGGGPWVILNDVWSFDGTTWTQFDHDPNIPGIQNAPWSPRSSMQSASLDCQRDISVQKIGSLFQNNVAGFLIQVTNNGLTTETYYLADVLPDDIDIFYAGSNDPNMAYLIDNTSYPFNLAFFAGTIAPGQTFDFYVFTEPIIGQGGLTFNNIAIVSTASTPDDSPGNDISVWPITMP